MNAIGLLLVWVAVQVSVFCLAGIALYAVARRRNPATGAWAAGAALAMAVGISALALSPWPRWWSLDASAAASPAVPDAVLREIAADETPHERLPPGLMVGPIEKGAAGNAPDTVAENQQEPQHGWQSALARLRSDVSRTSVALSTPSWRWPAWVAVAILAGCLLALVRLIVAVGAAHRYRNLASPVFDASLNRLIEQVREQIGCTRPIELRETAAMCSPSTIGWLRPAIILPADWRSWSAQERRAVVAHEVAHVARGDFAVWLLAQLGVVLHFYNPLVHFLAGRLRLEQEMAADVWGAKLLGSRQLYLTILAEMALRTSDPPAAWAMRPFLPTRGTLIRRVEMLHRQKVLPKVSASNVRRTSLAVAVLILGCFIAGLRGPGVRALVDAAPPADAAHKVAERSMAQAVAAAGNAARRRQSFNKLKQIGIAMQNYHDVYKQFPPAVLIGPDGKTPYSWRVALLPFLGKQDLYKRYKKDEPWDSKHNRQLIAEAAELFSVPSEGANGDCGYFLITGPGTVFDPANEPPSMRKIIDGLSKTIGIVEAKRSVPWTKPEDINYDPQKPLPKLGGFFEGGYHAGLMDASVHFLSDQMDAATLRALFSRAGREPVAIP